MKTSEDNYKRRRKERCPKERKEARVPVCHKPSIRSTVTRLYSPLPMFSLFFSYRTCSITKREGEREEGEGETDRQIDRYREGQRGEGRKQKNQYFRRDSRGATRVSSQSLEGFTRGQSTVKVCLCLKQIQHPSSLCHIISLPLRLVFLDAADS